MRWPHVAADRSGWAQCAFSQCHAEQDKETHGSFQPLDPIDLASAKGRAYVYTLLLSTWVSVSTCTGIVGFTSSKHVDLTQSVV